MIAGSTETMTDVQEDAVQHGRRWWIFAVLALAQLMV
ncbi:MAG: hypothetical protein JWN72_75, partial [Thermoleophilia bacterium]|nr:hypothetical protein [Thermoleophilia bacterium]